MKDEGERLENLALREDRRRATVNAGASLGNFLSLRPEGVK